MYRPDGRQTPFRTCGQAVERRPVMGRSPSEAASIRIGHPRRRASQALAGRRRRNQAVISGLIRWSLCVPSQKGPAQAALTALQQSEAESAAGECANAPASTKVGESSTPGRHSVGLPGRSSHSSRRRRRVDGSGVGGTAPTPATHGRVWTSEGTRTRWSPISQSSEEPGLREPEVGFATHRSARARNELALGALPGRSARLSPLAAVPVDPVSGAPNPGVDGRNRH